MQENTETKGMIEVYLKNEKSNAYIFLSKIFIVFGVVTLASFFLFNGSYVYCGLFLLFSVLYFIFRKKMALNSITLGRLSLEYMVVLGLVFLTQQIAFGILFFGAAILFRISIRELRFVVTDAGVTKDFFPKKTFSWTELESVILKSGIFTINFKNKDIIQGYVLKTQPNDQQDFSF